MSRRPSKNSGHLRIQLTLDPLVHPTLTALLQPLSRWKRKERLVALAYQGLNAESVMVHGAAERNSACGVPSAAANETGWRPQVDGDVLAALGIDLGPS